MALTAKVYGLFLKSLANKEVDLDTDVLKGMLCTSAYTPNQDTHQYKADVTNEVAATGGYTAGGQTLTGVTVTYNASTNTLMLDANDPVWAGSTITARFLVVYDDTAANKPLICYWDFGQDEISSSGNFTGTISGSGLLTLTAA